MSAYIEQSLDVLIPAFAESWAEGAPDTYVLLDVIFRAFEKLKSDAQAAEPEPEPSGCHTMTDGTTVYHGAGCEHDTGDTFFYDGSEWRY